MSKGLKWLSGVTVAAMFLVLQAGALVSKTGSGDGCGDSWPMCHGEWLPPLQFHSLVEYGHRLISALAGILVIWMAIAVWRRFKDRAEIRLLIPTAVGVLLLQGWLGAMAVMWPQPKTVLALHFGISLIAFAAVLLPTILLMQWERGTTHRDKPLGTSLRRWIWFSLIYAYMVVYTGAYVRHTGANTACPDWPLCNGQWVPELSGLVGIHFGHRVASALLVALLVWLVRLAAGVRKERPDIYWGSVVALVTVVLQALSGGLSVLTQLAVAPVMLHSVLITLLFGAISYLCLQSMPERAPDHAPQSRRLGTDPSRSAV